MISFATTFEAMFQATPLGDDRFRFSGPRTKWRRVYGGLVISQSLAACNRTVTSNKSIHSLHAYFLLPGDPSEPLLCEVTCLREGRSFAARSCRAIQNDQVIFTLNASCHSEENGFEHFIPPPQVPLPENLSSFEELHRRYTPERPRRIFEYCADFTPLDIRPTDPARYFPAVGDQSRDDVQAVWFKASSPLVRSPALHLEVLAYASDMTILDATLAPHRRSVTDGGIQPASLDHAIWFHRPVIADDWMLYVAYTPSTSKALGLAIGRIYARSGELIASVAQEGLIRRMNN